MPDKKKKYLARLAGCTTEQLMALKAHLAETKGRRNAEFMLTCVCTVLFARMGLAS